MKQQPRTQFPAAHPKEPVAIIGIGCRFAGVSGVEEFWRVLRDGIETTGEYPGGRLPDIDAAYAAKRGIATRRGGFLKDIDRFDAEFFGVSPREAALLDPQQRLLLEVAWEAIEDAGIPASKLAGSETGVFAGMWISDYESCLLEQAEGREFYATTGSGRYSASGRLAYFFDLRGPAVTLDSACSSSVAAIHLACQSLWMGESELALAGGVNIILRTEITTAYCAANMLSPDGRSKFGDASADGYVRSEGAGMLLLKPLAKALADGDPVYALIRGSAVNNDGRASGQLIAPSREGQQAALRSAFRSAGVDGGAIDYIEAHGTGTPVGDPIEIESIGAVVDTPERKRPCLLGSVKTNIGHSEAAAGAAGVIKAALALERGVIPASLHLSEPNPSIAWDKLPVAVQTALGPWPHTGPVRLAGVSGFGITGTNGHVVLENFEAAPVAPASDGRERLFVLSAQSQVALEAMARAWRERMGTDPEWPSSLADLAYTAGVRREHQEFRLAIVASTRSELDEKLAQWLRGEPGEYVSSARRTLREEPKTVFVFPGQGSQWAGMTRGLFGEPVFYQMLVKCDAAIRQFAGWSVMERLLAEEMPEEAWVAQPCLFAVMVSLAELWKSWGIEPQAVVGHSMGECAAAVVCGALSLEDGAAVISSRSRLMKRVSGKGMMAFAAMAKDEARALANEYGGEVSVAVDNGPGSTVFSGATEAVEDVMRRLNEREVFCRRVKVDVASHSSQMDILLPELAESLRHLQPRSGAIPFYSATKGQIEDGAALDAGYWTRNLREAVEFSRAVESLLGDGFNAFLEVSPHPLLVRTVEEHIGRSGKHAIAGGSLRRDEREAAGIQSSLGALFVAGGVSGFARLYPQGRCLRLPAYPWQRERHWIEAKKLRASLGEELAEGRPRSAAEDLYQLCWEETAIRGGAAATGEWAVLGSETGVAVEMISRLEALGNRCVHLTDAEDLASAMTAGAHFRGVIRIASASGGGARAASSDVLDVIAVVRAAAGAAKPPRLWLVSSGAWRLAGDASDVNIAQGSAWGLGRVIEREHPELRCVNVDLPAAPGREEIAALARLAGQDAVEEQVAVRGEKLFVPRYRPAPFAVESKQSQLGADATYLITGGLGGVGLHVAEWCVKRGARNLVLVGRSGADEAARKRIAALESMGARVCVRGADLSEQEQVQGLVESIHADLPPLKGVFHLAAVTEAALVANIGEDGLTRVLRAKAATACNLDRCLQDDELDFFVLFSSITATISQPGLGSYAAANAYLDALARSRRARGLAAQSIQWGPWASTGLVTRGAGRGGVWDYERVGVHAFDPPAALHILASAMENAGADLMAVRADWEKFARSFEHGGAPGAFARLLPRQEKASAPEQPQAVREQLEQVQTAARRGILEAHLQKALASVLKTDAQRIDRTKPFGTMGVDSLMGLEYVRRLGAATLLRLPATIVFNYPTVERLAGEIARRMGIALDDAAKTAVAAVNGASRTSASVDALTDEEAIEALMGKAQTA